MMSLLRGNQHRTQLPPHSDLLNDLPDKANSEQILQFLVNKTSRLVRAPNCPCLYCTKQSDNALLVLEEAWNARAARARSFNSIPHTTPINTTGHPQMPFGSAFVISEPSPIQVSPGSGPMRQVRPPSRSVASRPTANISRANSGPKMLYPPISRIGALSQLPATQPLQGPIQMLGQSSPSQIPTQPAPYPTSSSAMPLLDRGPITFHQAQGGQLTYQGMAIRAEPGMLRRDPTNSHSGRAKADLSREAQLAMLAHILKERQSQQNRGRTPRPRSRGRGNGNGITGRMGLDAHSPPEGSGQNQTNAIKRGSLGLGSGNWARGRGGGGERNGRGGGNAG